MLQKFDEVDGEVKSNHRLADFVVTGETISRVLGYLKGEFMKAWEQNTDTQQLTVLHNNSLSVLLIRYAFNKRVEKEFGIEPEELLRDLKNFASEIGVDYHSDKQLPTNAVWLTRRLNMIKSDLSIAGLEIDETKNYERMIWIKKDPKKENRQAENSDLSSEIKKILFAMDMFKRLVAEKNSDNISFDDFQMNLTSSGKFYMSDAHLMITELIKYGLLKQDVLGLLSLSASHS